MEKLVWNVFCRDMNADTIKIFNVFEHYRFAEDVKKLILKCKDRDAFERDLKSSLMYYFWSKYEWEVLISPRLDGKGKNAMKIDVYWQIRNNWDRFVDYVWVSKRKSKDE